MSRPGWNDYPCLEWPGPRNADGYGILNTTVNGKKRSYRQHRIVYEAVFGQIPEGLVLDHLCRNRGCSQPWHLEPVTRGENVKRGISSQVQKARHAARTHCKNGHLLSDENVRMVKDSRGVFYRECVTCRQAISRKSKAKAKLG
jgi:hypothetical protein